MISYIKFFLLGTLLGSTGLSMGMERFQAVLAKAKKHPWIAAGTAVVSVTALVALKAYLKKQVAAKRPVSIIDLTGITPESPLFAILPVTMVPDVLRDSADAGIAPAPADVQPVTPDNPASDIGAAAVLPVFDIGARAQSPTHDTVAGDSQEAIDLACAGLVHEVITTLEEIEIEQTRRDFARDIVEQVIFDAIESAVQKQADQALQAEALKTLPIVVEAAYFPEKQLPIPTPRVSPVLPYQEVTRGAEVVGGVGSAAMTELSADPMMGSGFSMDIVGLDDMSGPLAPGFATQKVFKKFNETYNEIQGLSREHFLESIAQGGRYIAYILHGVGDPLPTPSCGLPEGAKRRDFRYVKAIHDIMWYLYNEALNKNEGHEEGTFIIKDPGSKLFNSLLSYVQLCDPTWQQEKKHCDLFAYSRASSHLKDYYTAAGLPKLPHYGIFTDVTSGIHLPADKHHILFGQLDPQRELLFIKMENAGLSTQEVARHGAELARSVWVKASSGSFYDDQFRKERVPKVLSSAFCVAHKADAQKIQKIKGFGIQSLIHMAGDQSELQALVRESKAVYDHISLRMGREIIITPEDTCSALLFCKEFQDQKQELDEVLYQVGLVKALVKEIKVAELKLWDKPSCHKLKQSRAADLGCVQPAIASQSERLSVLREMLATLVNQLTKADLPQVERYCALLNAMIRPDKKAVDIINDLIEYSYLLDDMNALSVHDYILRLEENERQRELKRQEAIQIKIHVQALGQHAQQRINELVDSLEQELEFGELSEDSPAVQEVLKGIFHEYTGIHKVVRDAHNFGVICGDYSPADDQYTLAALEHALSVRLKEIASRMKTTEANIRKLHVCGEALKQLFFEGVRVDLLRLFNKKSTRDAGDLQKRASQDLEVSLRRIVDCTIQDCYERLFGIGVIVENSPFCADFDAAQFREEFSRRCEVDSATLKIRIRAIVDSFAVEDQFIALDASEEEAIERLKKSRITSFELFCSREMGSLSIYELETMAEVTKFKQQEKLKNFVPVVEGQTLGARAAEFSDATAQAAQVGWQWATDMGTRGLAFLAAYRQAQAEEKPGTSGL